MRSRLVVPVLLAACLISSIALAQSGKRTATFQALAASGVSGEAVLDPNPRGGTNIHGQVRGLQPNTLYISRVYEVDGACGTGTPSVVVTEFTSNPNGMGVWNKKIVQDITSIQSISVELAEGNIVQACAGVTP